ncbi:guanylate cyclase [Sulfuricella sp. T08]|uniref:CHASE2 domain-containing protein n=1 Tax=Sulfuricella sp. T08 TaxID=1632857 RepID=UPI000617A0CC|nr:adenylate/guanylate cyclase domain-containing protein [Sulfuricella sp. T08]GAO37032.1 guanylate cyclase [Sulfuricella sp. T08]
MNLGPALKKNAIPIALGVAVLLVFLLHATRVVNIPLIQHIEAISYDARLQLTMPKTLDRRIIIVDIDEKSLAEEGRWPWGRDKLATMLDRLFDQYHVAVVGFDVVFAEKDESSGLKVLEQLSQKELKNLPQFQASLSQLRPQLDHDSIFAQKLASRPVVLGYYFTSNEDRISGLLPAPTFPAGSFKGSNTAFVGATGYGANLPEFQKAAHSAGHFNPLTDFDGVARRVPMLMEYRGAFYESLSLAVFRTLSGNSAIQAVFEEGAGNIGDSMEWLRVGKLKIPVDENISALVPYRGKQGSFPYVSATDVLHGRVSAQELGGAIVLVGTTAPGLMDLRSTPVGAVYPGVEVHANLITGMLDHNIKQKPAFMMGAEITEMLLLGLVLAFTLPLLGPVKASLTALAALLLVVGINLSLWQSANMVMPLAAAMLMIIALFMLSMSYGFFVESRAKRQITGLFGQYVPPELVDEMSENPGNFTMEGESREMTVLFSDVRGFTTISEGLSPKELSRMMNEYMTPMTRIIHKHRGTIDKYIGDAIMAFWGAPLADPEHSRHALLAAMEMQQTLTQLREQFKTKGWPEIRIGVGINTGTMSVGNMGSEFRMAYTVMGDAVNLASRLESITKQYGVGIIVGENTHKAVPDVVFRELDRVRVKGKDEPVAIYEPLGAAGQVDKTTLDELKLFQQVLKLYRAQDWDLAEVQLLNLQKASPECTLYRLYLERITYFRDHPPGVEWDGAFTFKTK